MYILNEYNQVVIDLLGNKKRRIIRNSQKNPKLPIIQNGLMFVRRLSTIRRIVFDNNRTYN